MRLPRLTTLSPVARLGIAVFAFLLLNLAVGAILPDLRLDLTAERLYTLSPVSRDILTELNEPITLRFYVSQGILDTSGPYAAYANHVEELLDVYRRRSRGHIKIEIVNPEPFSAEEDRAIGFGLKPVPIDSAGGQGFFGIAGTNSTDDTELIPYLAPEREPFLEYDLTKLIQGLASPKKPVIGLLDGGHELDGSEGGNAAMEQVKQLFSVRNLSADITSIDPAISVLLIVHPRGFNPGLRYAIDQFVLGGGHALIFVDPEAETAGTEDSRTGAIQGGGTSDLPDLFKAWGIGYDPLHVVGDWSQALRIEAQSLGRQVVTDYPPYIAVTPPYLKADDPVTGNLKVVNLMTAGALSPLPGATTSFTPLIKSSPQSALIETLDASSLTDPLEITHKYHPGGEEAAGYTLAARITGSVATAFPNGPPSGKPAATPLKESVKPTTLIVVADSDLLADRAWIDVRQSGGGPNGGTVGIPYAGNGDFLINALENLTGSPALSSLRGRGMATRRLTRLDNLQRDAEDEFRASEDSLARKLDTIRKQLATVTPGTNDKALLGAERQETIRRFHNEMAETRRELRDVQHDLRRTIDHLIGRIRLLDIMLVPVLVVLAAVFHAWRERRRVRTI
jgi:ABC-type uncharacterized transport system involved in gliding motility auxiliary subunit